MRRRRMKHHEKTAKSRAPARSTRADALAFLDQAKQKIDGAVKQSTAEIRALVAQIAIFREGELLTTEEEAPFIQMKIR